MFSLAIPAMPADSNCDYFGLNPKSADRLRILARIHSAAIILMNYIADCSWYLPQSPVNCRIPCEDESPASKSLWQLP